MVDDHPSIRENLRYLLNAEDDLTVVAVAKDGAGALKLAREHRPDVVVLDHGLPDQNGIALARTIHQEGLARRIVLYTLDEEACVGASASGVDACIEKDAPSSVLVAAIRGGPKPLARAGRLLLVEDDADARATMKMALEDQDIDVVEAADGIEALVEAAKQPPTVVLLDLTLPRLSGQEFMTAYRQIPGRHAPVVVVSGARDGREVAIQIGANAYLQKPFSIEDLARTVREVKPTDKPARPA